MSNEIAGMPNELTGLPNEVAESSNAAKCPVAHAGEPSPGTTATETASPLHGAVTHTSRKITRNEHWWPDRLDLAILHQNNKLADPTGPGLQLRRGVQERLTSTRSSRTSTPS